MNFNLIRGQLHSLFPEYDSLGPGLDAMEEILGNREAVSLGNIVKGIMKLYCG